MSSPSRGPPAKHTIPPPPFSKSQPSIPRIPPEILSFFSSGFSLSWLIGPISFSLFLFHPLFLFFSFLFPPCPLNCQSSAPPCRVGYSTHGGLMLGGYWRPEILGVTAARPRALASAISPILRSRLSHVLILLPWSFTPLPFPFSTGNRGQHGASHHETRGCWSILAHTFGILGSSVSPSR